MNRAKAQHFILVYPSLNEFSLVKGLSLTYLSKSEYSSPSHENDFTKLGLNPRTVDIVVVKIGYLEPELFAMRANWLLALTPGGVDQDIEHLPYKRLTRPIFPLNRNMKEPDLKAKLVPVM